MAEQVAMLLIVITRQKSSLEEGRGGLMGLWAGGRRKG